MPFMVIPTEQILTFRDRRGLICASLLVVVVGPWNYLNIAWLSNLMPNHIALLCPNDKLLGCTTVRRQQSYKGVLAPPPLSVDAGIGTTGGPSSCLGWSLVNIPVRIWAFFGLGLQDRDENRGDVRLDRTRVKGKRK